MSCFSCLAAAVPFPAQHADATDDDHEPDRPMDFDEEREFADQGTQGPLTDMDMEENSEILVLMLKHNSHLTQWYPIQLQERGRIGHSPADTQWDRGNGNRFYEVNIWMWCRGRPRMVSIAEAERIRAERLRESRIRVTDTRKRRSEAEAAAGAADGGGGSD